MAETNANHDAAGERVSYKDLLSNPQMAVLLFARIIDPLATTSIYAYMFAQLKWLSPDASSVEIAFQAGLLAASKTAAKCCTGLFWGRLSDQSFGGRRLVLLIGLLSSCFASVGYGLSRSFGVAIFWQVFGGGTSAVIGIIRCMVAEMETRKSHRSRALLLLPLAGSVGQLLGPIMGGFLTSIDGRGFLGRYPFFVPNAIIAVMYGVSFVGCYFMVGETLETFDESQGSGLQQCLRRLVALIRRKKFDSHGYTRLDGHEGEQLVLDPQRSSHENSPIAADMESTLKSSSLTFWQIWTPQVICTLTAHFIIAGHISTFGTTWAVFLASPVSKVSDSSLIHFTGGVGLSPPQIGTFNSILSLLGIGLQTLLPRLTDRFSTVTVWRTSLCFFPFVYVLAPYSAYMAANVNMTVAWIVMSTAFALFVVGRVGAQPSMTLLINACIPSPDARGTINVAGTVVGNLSRSVIPVVVMSVYGWGYEHNIVALGFWVMSAWAVVAIVASGWVKRTDGRQVMEAETSLESERRRGT